MRKKNNIKTKGLNIMELNVKQKSVVDVLYKTYKSDTVTRQEINDLVKSKKIVNPSSISYLWVMMLKIQHQ